MNDSVSEGKGRSGKHFRRFRYQKGTATVFIALLVLVLIGFSALAIDVGYLTVSRNELQNIADGAALAACRELGYRYQHMSAEAQRSYVCDPAEIKNKAIQVGNENGAGGLRGLIISPEDVTIGTWDGNRLTPKLVQPDAVCVTARRDNYVNGPIPTFFARVLNIDTIDVSARATAALMGQGSTDSGELELPVGISSYFFEDGNVFNDAIVFNPTNDPASCGGWTSYDLYPPNDALLRKILTGNIVSPETATGKTVFNFIGGNLSNRTFDALLSRFEMRGYDVTESDAPVSFDSEGQPVTGPLPDSTPGTIPLMEKGRRALYPDGISRNRHRWDTVIVVYDRADCSNPNTSLRIVGYTKISVTDVQIAPDKRVVGHIYGNQFSEFATRGGGGEFGLKGSIPELVE